jgi:hypothetical protein
VPSAVYPLEASLFTTPRLYAANSAPEPPASTSFPITSSQALLAAGISALSMLVSTLSSPLSADAFVKSHRQSTASAVCEVFSLLEVHHEPKLLVQLLKLAFTWLGERPSESTGIAARVWKLIVRRIHAGASPNEPQWHTVDDELGKIIGLIKLENTGSSWPDVEAAIMFCASNDTMSNLRVSSHGLALGIIINAPL